MNNPDNILTQILARKKEEINVRKTIHSIEDLEKTARNQEDPRGFVEAIIKKIEIGETAIIAELKKASPSKGIIRPNFEPAIIAKSYSQNGATCLSVLTDIDFFQGHNDFVCIARNVSGLPVLRKDFMIDLWQISESRAIGSDCVLLIVAALDDLQMSNLATAANDYGMDVLIEVHDLQELERALKIDTCMIGINNRNLRTFETRLETTIELMSHIPNGRIVVTESGIESITDVMNLKDKGVNAFLIGESLMKAPDPGSKLAALV